MSVGESELSCGALYLTDLVQCQKSLGVQHILIGSFKLLMRPPTPQGQQARAKC